MSPEMRLIRLIRAIEPGKHSKLDKITLNCDQIAKIAK
jgi:hypothetical protein